MKKQIITFIVLALCTISGAIWIGYDVAHITDRDYETDTRIYETAAPDDKAAYAAKSADAEVVMYRLKAEYGYVTIYRADNSFYDRTDISMSVLPQKIQIEILHGIDLHSDRELYEFLETYST